MSLRLLRILQGAALATPLVGTSCMVTAPGAVVTTQAGTVRADSQGEARLFSEMLAELQPAVLELLPDTSFDPEVELWLQDEPRLYAFPTSASAGAEGLWSETHGRILLSREADDPRRTLAHELTHAALGESWHALPGSIEEGLCDVVAGHLVPGGSLRLRAGRLASAALAAGGLQLRFELWPAGTAAIDVDDVPGRRRHGRPKDAMQLVLSGRDSAPIDPLEVFRVEAGLSSTRIQTGSKRGYYGLAYLLVGRIVERHGIGGLHRLCEDAMDRELEHVPEEWLLSAAGLARSSRSWRRSAGAAFGPLETRELLRMYPEVVEDTAGALLARAGDSADLEVWVLVEDSGRAVRANQPLHAGAGHPRASGARLGRPVEAGSLR